jgi:hypothetical protein
MFSPLFQQILADRGIVTDLNNKIVARIVSDYGSVFVAQGDVTTPPFVIFPDEVAVSGWQSGLKIDQKSFNNITIELQSAAMAALLQARVEAQTIHFDINPNDIDAARRSYTETVKLWHSRVYPALDYYVKNHHMLPDLAEYIRSLSPQDQIVEILRLEDKGFNFSKDLSKSILYSVAAPGTSQHLSMLALDIVEHENRDVRSILSRHGWFQTVISDEPHFTYLGVEENRLPSLGLKRVTIGDREYWIPDI